MTDEEITELIAQLKQIHHSLSGLLGDSLKNNQFKEISQFVPASELEYGDIGRVFFGYEFRVNEGKLAYLTSLYLTLGYTTLASRVVAYPIASEVVEKSHFYVSPDDREQIWDRSEVPGEFKKIHARTIENMIGELSRHNLEEIYSGLIQ